MNIINIIESYGIELKKSGAVYIGFCPFHDDVNTPNLTVYPKTQSFYCFACGKGGDAIRFISLIENIERKDVIKNLTLESAKLKLNQLNSSPKINFKNEVYFLVSNICREFLRKNQDKLDKVIQILHKFDKKMNSVENLSYKEGIQMVEKFKYYLYNI